MALLITGLPVVQKGREIGVLVRSNTNHSNKKTRQIKQYHEKCTYENKDIVNIKIWHPQVKIRKSTLQDTIKVLIMRRFVCVKTVDF